MSDITKRADTLPADFVSRLMSGIAESRATTIIPGGKPFFRLMKNGRYVFGPNNEEMQEGSHWAVNIMSMAHGWSCWVEGAPGKANDLAGEVLVSMTLPRPVQPQPIGETEFKELYSMEMKCLNGDDAGTEVVYRINSVGGKRAIMALMDEIYGQLARRPAYPCPVLVFSSDSYQHKKWGPTAYPIFTVIGWANMSGEVEPEAAAALPVGEAAFTAAPARKRKATLAAAPQQTIPVPAAPAVEPVQPAPTAQTHVGQRRRPSAA
jgi:hypothetical protein